jgi:hypothetical protein
MEIKKGMKKLKAFCVLLLFFVSAYSFSGQEEFCQGFKEGYKSIRGSMVIVPICPIKPITPIGSTDFREGLKAGIRAAN